MPYTIAYAHKDQTIETVIIIKRLQDILARTIIDLKIVERNKDY